MSKQDTNKPPASGEPSAFTMQIRNDAVAVITLDVPGEKMNVLKGDFAFQLLELLRTAENDDAIKAIVITGGKANSFAAGVDIGSFLQFENIEDAKKMIDEGHQAFNAIATSKKPVVAAIHGFCLGGGFELALACHARVASDDARTLIGLPEVKLGLLPGLGGTQRLPRLIGIMPALDAILTGRSYSAKRAKKLGMVDEVVRQSILLQAAAKRALALTKKTTTTSPSPLQKWTAQLSLPAMQRLLLEKNSFGRKFLFDKARARTLAKTQGNYPAAEKILDVIERGITLPLNKALEYECRGFCALVMSPEARQLIHIYFATTELKKENFGIPAEVSGRPIERLGILGGGLMGGGIAVVSLDKAGVLVRVKDINDRGVRGVFKHVHDYFHEQIKRHALSKSEAAQRTFNLTGSLDYAGFKNVDLVIEAVFEDLNIKHQVLQEIEALGNENTLFASNTSSLRVRDIAEVAQRPQNVIGMHYFSPVEKMPLLEVIVHDKTADWVTRTCVEFGRKQGKTVIVVKDGAGFYINRILVPYLNEAAHLAMEGVPLDSIDKAMVKWGMPVGPFKLLDEVGLDISAHMLPNVEAEFGVRMRGPGLLEKLLADDRKGKKSKKGFYDYGAKAKGKSIDTSVYAVLGVTPGKSMSPDAVAERCILPLLNEAVRCLEDNTVRCARDADIGAVFGIGFPAFRGGPLRYIDAVGAEAIVNKLQVLQQQHGERFEPATLLSDKVKSNMGFY